MRLIDADKILYFKGKDIVGEDAYITQKDVIDEMPTVEAEPIRHGHWIGIDDEPCEVFECDKCGYMAEDIGCADNKPNNFNYCPRCGAKMDEVEE